MNGALKWIGMVCGVLMAWTVQAAPHIETWQTDNGARVMFVRTDALPMVDIEVRFDAGSARDGKAWGVAAMTNALLDTGTRQHDEEAIAEGFNRLGARFGVDVGRDSASLSLRVLTRPEIMQPAVALFTEVLSAPTFPQEPFERVRTNTLTALKVAETKPGVVAGRLFWQTLYAGHPYGHPVSGTPETVAALSRDQIEAFYRRHYVARNGQITLVGDLTRAEAEALANRIMGALPAGEKAPPLPEPKPLKQAERREKPFVSSQTYLYLGQVGVKRGDPDYYALFLGNHLLGGAGFSSLLMEEVREKRGLVYGVYSYFVPLRVPGPWILSLSTKNTSADEAEQVVRKTLAQFMKGIDAEKLQAIKDNLLGGWPLRFDSNAEILGYASMIGFYGLPLDYLSRFPEAIRKLDVKAVLDAWRRHIHPQRLLTVRVGEIQGHAKPAAEK